MNLRDIKPSLIASQKSLSAPASRLGAVGDLKGDIKIDDGFLYYCIADYSSSNTVISVTFNYSSGVVLEKNTGVTTSEYESFQVLRPGLGNWKLNCPGAGLSNINITVVSITPARLSIEINTSGIDITTIPNKPCTLVGQASIWRRLPWGSLSWT